MIKNEVGDLVGEREPALCLLVTEVEEHDPVARPGPCTDAGFTETTSSPVSRAVANTACSASNFERS